MRGSKTKISIALATYNGEKYIAEQLKSIAHQKRVPDEMVICDDGSNDKTAEIIEDFSEIASFPVHFYTNDINLGVTGNFNKCLSLTSGDLIFLSDQDDFWFPDKIYIMEKIAQDNPSVSAFINDAEITDSELNKSGLTILEQVKSAGISENRHCLGCCLMVRKRLLKLTLPIPDKFQGHDIWLVTFADWLSEKKIDGAILQYYRRHSYNVTEDIIFDFSKKASRLRHFYQFWNKISSESIKKKKNRKNKDLELLYQGVNSAIKRSNRTRRSSLLFLKYNIEKKLDVLKKRELIQKKPVYTRIFLAVNLWLRSGYNFKRVIEDICGQR